ncbi:MAG: helix-turn-helix domain-containing protein [Terriglobales bacterium]
MGNGILRQLEASAETLDDCSEPSNVDLSGIVFHFQSPAGRVEPTDQPKRRQLVNTKELSEIWGVPESTLRYWRCAEIGPTYVKLGGRIKYDLADVERYVRANKRMPSVRAHGG